LLALLHQDTAQLVDDSDPAKRLADRATHAPLSEDVMKVKHLANEKHKSIGILKSSGEMLRQKISDLSAKREALLAELKQVEEALSQAQQEENQLPEMIKALEQERNIQARKALQMKKKLKPVEGSAYEDIKEIEKPIKFVGAPYRRSKLY